ncbi:hypothetical protein N658DRAFT_491015 [Parathielavia hyrcaniae]|uniref:Uncharacterized protein n=1 Tax=Parathielavia hyrcaniae TaxID=113614 RepID=A0AAN6QA36_9PEZI|nr:hypothetical protein N658DRAFT_491015 [Parathielavia hyrcaniae]
MSAMVPSPIAPSAFCLFPEIPALAFSLASRYPAPRVARCGMASRYEVPRDAGFTRGYCTRGAGSGKVSFGLLTYQLPAPSSTKVGWQRPGHACISFRPSTSQDARLRRLETAVQAVISDTGRSGGR